MSMNWYHPVLIGFITLMHEYIEFGVLSFNIYAVFSFDLLY